MESQRKMSRFNCFLHFCTETHTYTGTAGTDFLCNFRASVIFLFLEILAGGLWYPNPSAQQALTAALQAAEEMPWYLLDTQEKSFVQLNQKFIL